MMTITEKQNLADKFTVEVLTAEFGVSFTSLEEVEEDEELTDLWDILNEGFYETMTSAGL